MRASFKPLIVPLKNYPKEFEVAKNRGASWSVKRKTSGLGHLVFVGSPLAGRPCEPKFSPIETIRPYEIFTR
ncbi:uncharacterized protein VTP21DRAFT_8339 [Calcarisporiella thermophila]|uniref:uncharacterized protein n=1 Tax=Calcarisporiella thermophila TaxID=911321 RepID=UPI00374357C4